MTSGKVIISDICFWKNDESWYTNEVFFQAYGALLVEGLDVFDIKGTVNGLDTNSLGMVVVGGFFPHMRMSTVVQSVTHQFPGIDVMMLYASRDAPPQFQDKEYVHVQAWTADAGNGYVVRAGSDGVAGTFVLINVTAPLERCWERVSLRNTHWNCWKISLGWPV